MLVWRSQIIQTIHALPFFGEAVWDMVSILCSQLVGSTRDSCCGHCGGMAHGQRTEGHVWPGTFVARFPGQVPGRQAAEMVDTI